MADQSPILQLPYILPAQAQKHVTHNEALRLLDILVQLAVISRNLGVPPVSPVIGNRYIVKTPAGGAWVGQVNKIAVFTATGWEFLAPQAGWQAYVQTSSELVAFDGTVWATAGIPSEFDKLGVNTTANTTNRLAVASAASLFTHVGTDHQMKVNKATAADTASLLFQTGFSGRAEMGLAGSDNFSVKVSPDGTAFYTGFTVTRTDGLLTVPNGMSVASGLTLTGGATVAGAVTLSGAVTAGSTVALNGAVTAAGTVAFNGAVTAGSTLALNGAVTAGGTVTLNNTLTAGGTVALNGAVTAGAAGSVALNGPVTAAGPVMLNGAVTAGAGGLVTLNGPVIAANTVGLNGAVTAAGVVALNGVVTAGAAGSVALNGPVTAAGTVGLNGVVTAGAAGSVTLNGPVTAAGTVGLNGVVTAGAAGSVTLNGPVIAANTVGLNGAVTAAGVVALNGVVTAGAAGSVTLNGPMTAANTVTLNGAVTAAAAVTMNGVVTAGAAGSVALNGPVTAAGTVGLNGVVTAGAGGSVTLNGPVVAANTVALNGAVTGSAAGSVTLNGIVTLSGAVTSTGGMTVDGTLQGTSVQATATDVTANRLLRVGAFGLGTGAVIVDTDWNGIVVSGFYRTTSAATLNLPTAVSGWTVMHIQQDATNATQLAMRSGGDDIRFRRRTAGTWAAWTVMYGAGNLIGTVSQTGGVPTGAVLERGTGANGDYTRYADGTLICYRTNLSVTNASTASGSLFKSSAAVTWSFPSVFSVAPAVNVDCQSAGCWATMAGTPTTTSVALEAMSGVTQAAALTLRAMAVGRWF